MLIFTILFYIFFVTECHGFLKQHIPNSLSSKTKIKTNIFNKIGLYCNNIPNMLDYKPTYISNMLDYNPTYTLIWRECNDCKQLLNDIKDAKIRILYVDSSYYFLDETEIVDTPFLYKEEELIASTIFDIYETLFI